METTPASRSDSVSSTECSCSCSSVKLTASAGTTASESSMRAPNSLAPPPPRRGCRDVAALAVAALPRGRVPGDRLASVLLDLDDLLRGHVELLGELLRGGLAPEVL